MAPCEEFNCRCKQCRDFLPMQAEMVKQARDIEAAKHKALANDFVKALGALYAERAYGQVRP